MDINLIKARLISFGWSALVLIAGAVIGVLASPEFAALVTAHFGEGLVSTLILMGVTELVKHLRNMRVIRNAQLGARGRGEPEPFVLI